MSLTVCDCLRVGLLLLAVGLLASCSWIRPYPNNLDKNLQIRTETGSGSIFSSTRASVGIYRVDGQCRIEYEGTIDLDKPVIFVGLPSDRLSYLIFSFFSSSFLAHARTSISQETLLRTRTNYSYQIDVSYRNSIYNVVVREHHPRKHGSREIELKRLDACREQIAARRWATGRTRGRVLDVNGAQHGPIGPKAVVS